VRRQQSRAARWVGWGELHMTLATVTSCPSDSLSHHAVAEEHAQQWRGTSSALPLNVISMSASYFSVIMAYTCCVRRALARWMRLLTAPRWTRPRQQGRQSSHHCQHAVQRRARSEGSVH
jgi:hypothetical protein